SQQTIRLLNGDPFLGDARLYLAREDGDDGQPVGRWTEAATIAAPGRTILHWNHRTDYRADPATCEDLYRRATEAEKQRMEKRRRAEDERRAEETRCEKLWQEFTPAWAKGYLAAELRQNESDIMTDYFSYSIMETVLLGFSKSDRNSFAEMRKLAATFPPTAHLAGSEGVEHRENYSGGSGYYLGGPSSYSGWTIRKHSLKYGLPRGGSAVISFSHWILNH
ncbi:MAG: fusion protein, partial [Desulfovibrionaceae bacterium]|nr:fusion protein [Desulfovibrionaceae bacterium]